MWGPNPDISKRFFSFLKVQTSSNAHPASSSTGSRVPSQEYEQQGHEIDHLPPSSAKVKNEWSYTSMLPICLMVCTGTTFYFQKKAYI
jgi:hypothetical protein